MAKVKFLGLVAASALMLGAVAAKADTVTIWVEDTGVGGGLTKVATDTEAAPTASATVSNYTIGGFTIKTANGSNDSPTGPGGSIEFDSLSLDITTAGVAKTGETLNIFMTDSGLVGSGTWAFSPSLTSNKLLTGGATLTEAVFVDATNGDATSIGSATELVSHTFTGIGTSTPGPFEVAGLTGAYSITEEYSIAAAAAGVSANGTIDVSAVPELSTWVMMIAGFLSLGFVGYSKRDRVARGEI